MNNIVSTMKFTLRYSKVLAMVLLVPPLLAEPKEPDSGSEDCYNRATNTCNRTNPGKDMGDKVYRDCINDHLDWCDDYEPVEGARYLPMLNSQGRFLTHGLFINLSSPKEAPDKLAPSRIGRGSKLAPVYE